MSIRPKVRETILAIVEEFFAKNNAAFLYICDTSGGMQKMRNRLFKNTGTANPLKNSGDAVLVVYG